MVHANIKNNIVDAKTLAHLLRTNCIPECYIGSAELRGKKEMIRYGTKMIRERTTTINFMHTLTDKYDVDLKKN